MLSLCFTIRPNASVQRWESSLGSELLACLEESGVMTKKTNTNQCQRGGSGTQHQTALTGAGEPWCSLSWQAVLQEVWESCMTQQFCCREGRGKAKRMKVLTTGVPVPNSRAALFRREGGSM